MRVIFETDPKKFLHDNREYLCAREAEHNLILSLCHKAALGKAQEEVMASVKVTGESDEEIVLSAIQMQGRHIVLSHANDGEAVRFLAQAIARQKNRLSGIVGPSDVSSSFSDQWTETTGQKSVDYMDQIIYVLTKVTMPQNMPDGQLRRALPNDTKLIAKWLREFAEKVLPKAEHVNEAQALEKARRYIDEQMMFVWDVKGRPVSQVAIMTTDTVTRIGGVYTPDQYRGLGYASAAVAHISQREMSAGKKRCCLYADASNPVSNSMYRKIGYEFIGRSSMYILE